MHIAAHLQSIRNQIIVAEQDYGRISHSVRLLAVTKGQNTQAIEAAIVAGQTAFAENYVQEALPKIHQLVAHPLEWHFIGAIQSNKTRALAENFSWVQTISNIKIAERLQQQRPTHLAPLNVCLQIKISEDPNKAGISLDQLIPLATQITQLPNLRLRGLMTLPPALQEFNQQCVIFKEVFLAFQKLNSVGFNLDTLSMGMSHDFIAAIAEGSTMVRIGTAIFGTRKRKT